MRYVSIDIETTGLDKNKNQIVEVGAVIDTLPNVEDKATLRQSVDSLPKFRAVLIHKEMQMGAYCANLHRDLWPEILSMTPNQTEYAGTKNHFVPTYYCLPEHLEMTLYRWLHTSFGTEPVLRTEKYAGAYEPIKINVAGKNAASFDIPFLEALPGWQGLIKFHRRMIDPAILCARPGDEHLPDLQECLKRSNIEKTVSHTAVDDALDVIRIIRANFRG